MNRCNQIQSSFLFSSFLSFSFIFCLVHETTLRGNYFTCYFPRDEKLKIFFPCLVIPSKEPEDIILFHFPYLF